MIRDPSGHTVNYVAVERDVTHEVNSPTSCAKRKKEAVGLAGGVAHDFNNM